jgi:hypothetical protein
MFLFFSIQIIYFTLEFYARLLGCMVLRCYRELDIFLTRENVKVSSKKFIVEFF